MPSTRYELISLPPPRIEPTGSAPIILIFGIASFNRFATPVIVPPVPTEITTMSRLSPKSLIISSAVF